MRCIMALQQSSVLAVSLLCMPTLKQKLVWKVVFSIFGQNHNVLPGLLCLRRATCLLFSLPEMQNLGITLELDLKGAKITCPAFGLCSSPIEYSTIGHIAMDLTSLAYQPKSREPSARPTKHVPIALSQRKSAFPARVQKLDDDEDDKTLFRPDCTTVSDEEDEDEKLLVQPPFSTEA